MKCIRVTDYVSERAPGSISGDSVTGKLPEPTIGEMSVVVSHIPRCVSVGSTLASLSSDHSHLSRHTTRDDETVDGSVYGAQSVQEMRDSVLESSPSLSAKLTGKKRKTDIATLRKVSDAELGANKKTCFEYLPLHATTTSSLRMLAQKEDGSVLNKLHAFVRQQIEVFTATAGDMAQPAPGRKNPIRLHQVGLRCVHCKNLPSRERVKRAICYPSSVGRVYHSVSDMKFDHFSNCKGLPDELRSQLNTLKVQCKRGSDRRTGGGSSSSTAQYYHDSARHMGMEDRGEGIFMVGYVATDSVPAPASTMSHVTNMGLKVSETPSSNQQQPRMSIAPLAMTFDPSRTIAALSSSIPFYHIPMAGFHPSTHGISFRQHHFQVAAPGPEKLASQIVKPRVEASPPAIVAPHNDTATPRSLVLLCMETDPQYLNPLHCFVRRNVEVFIANEADIAAPAPGRKTRVTMGQVGIRCIHCAKLPSKQRVKRAICYPPSISGIYHSISNMKFDHFGSCRALPAAARAEFTDLRINCNRRGGSTSNGSRGMSNSTAQYYHDSALRLGLVDTPLTGMRFASGVHQNNVPSDGISALVMAATDPGVRADYNRRVLDDVICGCSKVASC